MPDPATAAAASNLKSVLLQYPKLSATLLGALIGGTGGAIASESGAEGRGALQGAFLGGGLGLAGGMAGKGIASMAPKPEDALLMGSAAGGVAGGLMGKRKLEPWMTHRQEKQSMDKQAEEAMQKEAADRTLAFEYGMDVYCGNTQIKKEELAKAAGSPPEEFTTRSIAWLSALLEEKK